MKLTNFLKRYEPKKYWTKRQYVVNTCGGGGKLKKAFCLLYVRICETYNGASTGVQMNGGAVFESEADFVHGLTGIIISPYAHIGKNARIFHHVTIGAREVVPGDAPVIGDNVTIFPCATIIGKIRIGNNVKIGPNVCVWFDVPDNATVVVQKPRIILKG